jgi:hypothetical protein
MATKIKEVGITHTKKGTKIFINAESSNQPKGYQSIVNKTAKETSDQIPHADLLRALERMTPHLLLACELADNTDENGNFLQKVNFDSYWWRDDERYQDLTLTGIKMFGKKTITGIYLIGEKVTSLKGVVHLQTPLISLERMEEGKNYAQLPVLDAQFETFMFEIEEFRKGKTGDQQLSASFPENNNESKKAVKSNTEAVPV